MSLAGRLEDLALSDVFQILSVGRKTGTLIVNGSKGSALILFKNGLIVRAETDDIDSSLSDYLMSAGLVKNTMVNMAIEVKKKLPSKSTAEILFDLGSISKDSLDKVTKKRVEKVIYRLMLWEDGDFQFELDDLEIENKSNLADFGWELSKGLNPEYLLMEGARVQDESSQAFTISSDEFAVEDAEEGADWEADWSSQPAERKDISALKSLTQELRFPNSASEITLLILRFASDIFQRGILFMVGKDEMVGLGQFGLDIEMADEKVRAIVLRPDRSNFFKKLFLEQIPYKGTMPKDEVTNNIMGVLGGLWPSEVTIFPVVAEDKVVALLYCDNLTSKDSSSETEGLEIFINHAGLALEKSLLQRRLHDMQNKDEA